MIDTPLIIDSPALLTAVVRLTIPRDQIRAVMGPAMTDVMTAVQAQGSAPAGPMFSHHFRMDPDIFDFEVGVPVRLPFAQAGRVVPGELPAGKVARTVYRGPYEGLGEAWREFDSWIAANGHEAQPGLWEFYLTGPNAGEPQTELNRPLIG